MERAAYMVHRVTVMIADETPHHDGGAVTLLIPLQYDFNVSDWFVPGP